MEYQLGYLIGDLALLTIWLILFLWRRDVRKEMLIISLIFGLVGLIVDPIYSADWWFPKTIGNMMPGIESFLFGFSTAGVASVIYEEIFRKKLKIKKTTEKKEARKNWRILKLGVLGLFLFFFSFFVLNLNSFYASFPAILIPSLIIWIKRKDLILNSLISGFLIMMASLVFYIVPELIYPGWIAHTWNFEMLSGITILKVPLEDLIWFFLAGLIIGPFYEYWQEGKLIKK